MTFSKKIFGKFITNIKSGRILFLLSLIIAMTAIPYSVHFGWEIDELKNSAMLELALIFVATLFFLTTMKEKTVVTYLVFATIFSFINTVFGLIAYDSSRILHKFTPTEKFYDNASIIVKTVQLLIINGFAISKLTMIVIIFLAWIFT